METCRQGVTNGWSVTSDRLQVPGTHDPWNPHLFWDTRAYVGTVGQRESGLRTKVWESECSPASGTSLAPGGFSRP